MSREKVAGLDLPRALGLSGDTVSSKFLAIDFETANSYSDSACAIGLVRVEDGIITRSEAFLIRPPQKQFLFTGIHGITWDHVENSPTFGDLWPQIEDFFRGVDFLAAHNASFDRRVLHACCERYGLVIPELPFICTVQLARKAWQVKPTRLPDVCRHLGISLDHHEALSDASACAQIVIAASSHVSQPSISRSPLS